MNNVGISVIVPVYNAERYIKRCIESILSQTFRDFELILIDDGSKDKSGEICDKYATEDERVKVIHKENGGVSKARNTGLDIASGKYVEMVDADDYLSKDTLEKLYKRAEDNNSDVVVFGIRNICGDLIRQTDVYDGDCTLEQFLTKFEDYVSNAILGASWNKLYKKEIIGDIRYNENLKYNEDTHFNFDVLSNCKTVSAQSWVWYNYVNDNPDSATKKRIENLFDVYLMTYKKATEFLKKSGMYEYNEQAEKSYFINQVTNAIIKIVSDSQMSRKEKIQEIRLIIENEDVSEAVKKAKPQNAYKEMIINNIKSRRPRIVYYICLLRNKIKK